jgi:hypothetical protein
MHPRELTPLLPHLSELPFILARHRQLNLLAEWLPHIRVDFFPLRHWIRRRNSIERPPVHIHAPLINDLGQIPIRRRDIRPRRRIKLT